MTGWNVSEGDEIAPGLRAVRLLAGGRRYEAYLAWADHRRALEPCSAAATTPATATAPAATTAPATATAPTTAPATATAPAATTAPATATAPAAGGDDGDDSYSDG